MKPSPAASQASSAPRAQGDPGPFLPAQVLRGRPGLRAALRAQVESQQLAPGVEAALWPLGG